MALKNTQTTVQYDDKQESSENKTAVEAREYDSSKTTTQPSMKVDATVEGSQ